MISVLQVLGAQLSTSADVRARLTTGEAAGEIDWQDNRILAAVLDGLVQGGFAKKLAGDEPVFRILKAPTPEEALRMDAKLYRELVGDKSEDLTGDRE